MLEGCTSWFVRGHLLFWWYIQTPLPERLDRQEFFGGRSSCGQRIFLTVMESVVMVMDTLVPWQNGKPLCWAVTVICSFADWNIPSDAHEAGMAAELIAFSNEDKYVDLYAGLVDRYLLSFLLRIRGFPAVQHSTWLLLSNLGQRLVQISRERRETSFLFRKCRVLVQSFIVVLHTWQFTSSRLHALVIIYSLHSSFFNYRLKFPLMDHGYRG